MIRSKSHVIMDIVLTTVGALLLLEATIALTRHEPLLYASGPKTGRAWEALFMGVFCFLVGVMGFVKRKKAHRRGRPGRPPWFDRLV